MDEPTHRIRNMHLRSRRSVLQLLAGSACVAASRSVLAMPQPAGVRSLSFLHTHTGERLEVDYFRGGRYESASLGVINHFLRDYRSGDEHSIDPGLLDILFGLQQQIGTDVRFEVICGYRSAATNEWMHEHSSGVAEHSLHMEGRAIDIRVSGFATARLHQLALDQQAGGVGYYARSDFIHVDTGRIRSWTG